MIERGTHKEEEVTLNGKKLFVTFDYEYDKGDASTGWPSGYTIYFIQAFDETGLPIELTKEQDKQIEDILTDRLTNEEE